jgi:hypothetical protein
MESSTMRSKWWGELLRQRAYSVCWRLRIFSDQSELSALGGLAFACGFHGGPSARLCVVKADDRLDNSMAEWPTQRCSWQSQLTSDKPALSGMK